MSSIPFDPTLVLGQLLDVKKIENLAEIAEAEKPLELAYDKLNNITRTSYKLKMLKSELENMGIEKHKLRSLDKELNLVQEKIAQSAVEYGREAVRTTERMQKIQNKQEQNTISYSVESPLDYERSHVTTFPLAFDSLTFDVQYMRTEENIQRDSSSSETVTKMNAKGKKQKGFTKFFGAEDKTKITASSKGNMMKKQTQNHKIEGTIVISAEATHKNAQIISPFILDPIKAVTAWNYNFPEDEILTDPFSMMEAALEDFTAKPEDKPCIQILSGCSTASSFVGFVHILQNESSRSTDTAKSLAKGMKETTEKSGFFSSGSGGYGSSKGVADSLKKMLSDSALNCHCSLICRGIVPSIVANSITTTVQKMDLDPSQVMEQLAAMQDSNNQGVNSCIENQTDKGKVGAQFISLSSEHMANSVANISKVEGEANKVIDTNSMMEAFSNFIEKAEAGEGGIPTNFYIKRLTKNDIAKCYIRKFYPSGILNAKDATRGAIGQAPEENDDGGE